MKPFVISHSADIDGASPVILCNMVYGKTDYELASTTEVDEIVTKFIENKENQQYDQLYITDLGVTKEVADLIQNSKEWKNKVLIFDHHASNLHLNHYDFAQVIVEENGVKQCGTTLFYQYLKKKFPEKINHIPVLEEYVELVRQLDTWDWFQNEEVRAKKLGQIFDVYGKEKYITYYTDRLKTLHHFYFSEFEEELLKIEEKRIQNYIDKKSKEMWTATIEGHTCGIVFAENYRSELGNALALMYQDKIDYVVMINTGGGISFRSCKDRVDLSEIAQIFGGGGHKKASGAPIPDAVRIALFERLFPGIQEIKEMEVDDEN